MKITFEGNTFHDILGQIADTLSMLSTSTPKLKEKAPNTTLNDILDDGLTVQGPGPEIAPAEKPAVNKPVAKPLDKPLDKPKQRTAKQLENDEKLRARAKAKVAAKQAAAPAPAPEPEPEPEPKAAAPMDPADMVKVRQKTIEDLQSAYASGHQKEVFDLLSRFGNGAKSFRELPPESFIPIREAIDAGAFT